MTAKLAVLAFDKVPDPVLAAWQDRFHGTGTALDQSPVFAEAASAAARDRPVVVVYSPEAVSAFTVLQSRATCLFTRKAILGEGVTASELASALPVAQVYFPLLDPTDEPSDGVCWERLPCPLVSWADRGASLHERVRRRHGSQADRKWRRFERAGLAIRPVTGAAALAAVTQVERRSWKAAAGQAMHQRGRQLDLYSQLIAKGAVTTDVAFDSERPVAYRMDARVADEVACLKWSFDDEYARLSPGFYLLTRGLLQSWGTTDLRQINLHGSPDTLKCLLATGSRRRQDHAYPPGSMATALRQERQCHDGRIWDAFQSKRGLRHVYQDNGRAARR